MIGFPSLSVAVEGPSRRGTCSSWVSSILSVVCGDFFHWLHLLSAREGEEKCPGRPLEPGVSMSLLVGRLAVPVVEVDQQCTRWVGDILVADVRQFSC